MRNKYLKFMDRNGLKDDLLRNFLYIEKYTVALEQIESAKEKLRTQIAAFDELADDIRVLETDLLADPNE